MRKFIRYLKPFRGLVLLVAVLLAVQAITELLLPDYMSNIVNVGIQQGGFENGVPTAITQANLDMIEPFMTEEQKELVRQSYEEDGEINGSAKYVLKDVSEETEDKLDEAFGTAEWTAIQALRPVIEAARDNGTLPAAKTEESSDTATDAAEEQDFGPEMLQMAMPAIAGLGPQDIETAREKAKKMDPATRDQTAASFAQYFSADAGVDTAKVQGIYLTKTGLTMLGIALISATAAIIVGYYASKVGSGVARKMRREVFTQVEGFSPNEFHRFSTASLITRTTNDITQIQQFTIMATRMLLFAPIMGIGGIIMALHTSVSLSWIIALAVVVLLGIVAVGVSIAMPKFKIIQKLIDRLNLVARENLTGLLVVRAFRTQQHEEDRFDEASTNLAKTMLFTNRVMISLMPGMMIVMNLASLAIVWFGAQQVQNAGFQVGSIMAYIQYTMIVIMSFLFVAGMFVMIPRASVSLNRIFEVLETEPEIREPEDPKPFDPAKLGVVEFNDVCFRYPGAEEPVLQDISFTAKPGEVTAIIGPTGCGKTTLINLIPRFYDATEGEVIVSGVNVKEANLHELRDEIGFVPQKGSLFSGTIASNLRYGAPNATDAELQHVTDVAQASEFVNANAEGLDATVSEGGANVSGGQRQRLSIARALAKKAPIYIFDDSFSALDAKTDKNLRNALKPDTKNATTIIVAQKVSSILDADQILVLEEGRIVGRGTHKELMVTCPPYIEIAESQLGTEGGDAA